MSINAIEFKIWMEYLDIIEHLIIGKLIHKYNQYSLAI